MNRIKNAILVSVLAALIPLSSFAAGASSVMTPRKPYVQRARGQLDAIAKGLHSVEKKLDQLDQASRIDCQRVLRQLWQKEKLARARLRAIANAPAEQRAALRKKEDALLVRLQKSYQHLLNQYFPKR